LVGPTPMKANNSPEYEKPLILLFFPIHRHLLTINKIVKMQFYCVYQIVITSIDILLLVAELKSVSSPHNRIFSE
jgi:hypothetical protein